MPSPRRLPGIQVDVAPPPAVEALPRLDIAVFAGFAATGPLHLPVAVESPTQYGLVFGSDAPLAWDEQRGERVLAHLGSSVRAFFANGGRRCWVIRVARTAELQALLPVQGATAVANRFAVPGMLALSTGPEAVLPAAVIARCEGSWSDGLRVSTALQSCSFSLSGWSALLAPVGQPDLVRYEFTTRLALRVGDLLQLGQHDGRCAYAIVQSIRASPVAAGPYRVEIRLCAAFEKTQASGSFSERPGTASVAGFCSAVAATMLSPTELRFDEPVTAQLEAGHWVRFVHGTSVVWQRIDEIGRLPAISGSPTAMAVDLTHASVSGPAWCQLDPLLPSALGDITRAQVLEYELRVEDPLNFDMRLSGLGLTPERSGNFWDQQRDADFFLPRDGLNATVAVEQQRFALAPESDPVPLAWLPLGVDASVGATVAAMPAHGSALERDGLANLSSDLFIDPELARDDIHGLLSHAEEIRLLRATPRTLFGLHAVLSIGLGGMFNEASLLAMPDLVHLGWRPRADAQAIVGLQTPGDPPPYWVTHRRSCSPAPDGAVAVDEPDFGVFLDASTRHLYAPTLEGPDAPVPLGAYRLAWTESEPGAQYALWETTFIDFSDEREVYHGTETQYVAMTTREGIYHYRVFAHAGDQRSASSNPVTVSVRADEWVQLDAATANQEMEQHWLTVHRAALRLAAACGDLFVVLSMPRHFGTVQAVRYTQRLRSVRQAPNMADDQAFGYSEARALSYGAMYFPWLQTETSVASSTSAPTRSPHIVPPDGVALGVLAARSSRRGAWIAAANEPMKSIVALASVVPATDWQALQNEQINLLRANPRGFFTLSADTLAIDPDLRPINVRRLMILLRRLALRRGTIYAFEPNSPELRRSIQSSFDQLMTDLFKRGAFAGATPEQSFRVVTDETINTSRDQDAGRFFVELRVAPSLPMRFLAVRLAQSGERLSVVEER
jgi:hypothetical protein